MLRRNSQTFRRRDWSRGAFFAERRFAGNETPTIVRSASSHPRMLAMISPAVRRIAGTDLARRRDKAPAAAFGCA